eukprot:TRINITY_DN2115_c0_g1_i2.p1 TRINITY_DN2115_c0_g1~~TRINITY_DN2115_c0_g1_i2.p1  ORF type:complete len:640 (+),score=192.42 TRINITY_DN2115_c0_g1_i2:1-1920(+)
MGQVSGKTQERQLEEEKVRIKQSELLQLKITTPIECALELHALETVGCILEIAATHLGLEEADGVALELGFNDKVVVDPSLTLEACGITQHSEFEILNVEQAQAAAAQKIDLCQSVRANRVLAIQLVCRLFPERLNECDKGYERTALHWAAEKNDPEVARLLLQAEADPNCKDKFGETALHRAVRTQSILVVRQLLDIGAESNAYDRNGRTPMFWAKGKAAEGAASSRGTSAEIQELVQLLGSAGAKDVSQEYLQLKQEAEAASAGSHTTENTSEDTSVPKVGELPESFRSNLEQTAVNTGGVEVLGMKEHELPEAMHEEIDLLTAAKERQVARVACVCRYAPARVHHCDPAYERTALHWAAEKNDPEVARLLLQAEADPNCKDKFGETALHRAVRMQSIDVVRMLVHKACADTNAYDRNGRTPMSWAKDFAAQEVLRASTGQAPRATTDTHRSLIELLEHANAQEESQEYLKHKAEGTWPKDKPRIVVGARSAQTLESIDQDICEAARKNQVSVIEAICWHCPERVHVRDESYERTALHWAAEKNDPEVARLLLQAEADPNCKDKFGETALHRAVRTQSIDVVRMLLHSDLNAKDPNGKTALYWAKNPVDDTEKETTTRMATLIELLEHAGAKDDAQV